MVLHECPEIENGKKRKPTSKRHETEFILHFKNAITRLLTTCVARTGRLCGIMHKLENVQFGPNSSSRKEQGIYMYIHMAEGGRTGNTEWTERSLKSSFTTLQLYSSAVGEHKMSYRAVGSMFVDTQQSVQCFCRTHSNKDTLEEVVITKKSTFAAKIIYILFLQTNLKVYKYINVSSPSSRFELFLPHLFFIFPSVSWSSGFLRML